MKTPRSAARSGTFGKVLVYAPIVLEVLNLVRRSQAAKRGKYVKARKRDRIIDGLLGHASRAVGGKGRKQRWF
ncbi:hypothetical protein HNQ07_002174 [Deinococcus metalli]|uniref:Uncharacterized protein n=1 Tax=Deinococcus metalli TaxID=1141878 RepID=A0A7W8KF04_9DEIO|nr:hypothetical protein [Deinococcus metalli]MBB5376710.1 hypothetical protein [Deinococcus metalli]GHF44764.1 hypothetical protein GCM10017781_21380 [Deinococcus metalli]